MPGPCPHSRPRSAGARVRAVSLHAESTEASAEFLTRTRRARTHVHRVFPDLRGTLITETTRNHE
jgi:hypothetical protein